MENQTPIFLPHGGYRNLLAYKKSDVIFQGTVLFCQRFLPLHGDRTVDQMKQAARSCKQNIAEGSAASGTSRESEIKCAMCIAASPRPRKPVGGEIARCAIESSAASFGLRLSSRREAASDSPYRVSPPHRTRNGSAVTKKHEKFEP